MTEVDSKEVLGDLRAAADDDFSNAEVLQTKLPETPASLHPADLTDAAPLLCVRSLSDSPDNFRPSTSEVRAFNHQQTGQSWIVDPAEGEARRNSKRFHTSAVDELDDLEVQGFGSDREEGSDEEKQVEEYKVTVTLADGKDSSDSSDGATKLPLTMAKLETLTDRKEGEDSSELPQLVRSQSVQSLTSNLYALAEELHARKAEVVSSPCRIFTDQDLKKNTSGEFASLVQSVLNMDLERVQELSDTGVSVNMALREEGKGTVHFSTLLHTVCDLPRHPDEEARSRCVRIIEILISAKANINPRNSKGSTPLMCACRQKNIEVVKLLISHSAHVHPCDERGHSCLNWAAALREEELPLQSSSPRELQPDDEERSSYLVELLMVATVQEQKERTRKEKAAAVSHPTKRRTSLALGEMKEASQQEQLVAYSEALKIIEPKSFPPLRMAVMQQNVSAALVMMACGAAPIWLHDAVRVGSLDLVRALLHFDADPAKQDTSGASSIDTAVQLGSPMEIVEMLRQNVHKTRRVSESNIIPRRISVASAISIRSLFKEPRSPSSRSLSFARSRSPKGYSGEDSSEDSQERRHIILEMISVVSAKCRVWFESNTFQCATFVVLFMALYLPDICVITDSDYLSLDVLLTLIFIFFSTDCAIQVIGFGKAYICSFFFIMDVIGTLSLLVEFSAVKTQMQANNLTQSSVVMRATRAAKIGARAGRLTRLVKLMRFLPFLRKRKQVAEESTAKVISSRLISRVSSVVACLIIFSVQVLPLPGTLSMPAQDFSIQMWTEHLRRSLEDGDDAVAVNDLVSEFRAFYHAKTSYQPYSFMNGTQVLWQRRGPALADRSMRIQYGNAIVHFDFSHQVHLEAGMNMIVITLTIFLMVTFSLLISRAVSKHALTHLEILLLKVRKIGRLIWLQVESLQSHFSHGNTKSANNEFANEDETVLLRDVLSKIGVLSAIRLMRPDEDAQALAFLGTGAVVLKHEEEEENVNREALAVRLQTVIQFDLENLEVENITTWRFNPIDFEDPSTAPFVCAKLLTTCVPLPLKHGGVSEIEISAFAETVQAGYSKSIPYHNFNHAVDTMHSVYVILQECRPLFSAIETYTLLMCAAAHDIGHPGFSNEFLVQTQHELALRYNDSAPLENMHSARLFEILLDPSTNIIGRLEESTRKDIRKMSIEAILHTDNSFHFNEVKALQMIHEVHDEDFRQTCARFIPGDDENDWPGEDIIAIFGEKDTRDTIRNVLLHYADISNSMKPFSIARVWADLVLEEFFVQGDKLKELGLPVPALNDRAKTQRPTSQIGFIEFIVSPLVFTIVKIIPPLAFSEQAMMGTVKYWFDEWASSASPSKSEYTQMVNRVKGLYEKANFAKQTGTLFKRWKSI